MNTDRIARNALVAFTIALAGVASWAVTDFRVPTIEAPVSNSANH